jgi:rSAM/selenodomain-associated transferase 2
MNADPKISIIIPTLNEAAGIGRTLEHCTSGSDTEVIVVDGGSADDTWGVAASFGVRVLSASAGRAGQMNTGARAARGEVLLFLHADTLLPPGFEDQVLKTVSLTGVSAGAFLLSLTPSSPGLKHIQCLANWRARVLQLPYGDQAIFLKKRVFKDLGGFSEMPFLEDLDLVRRLRRRGRVAILPVAVNSSARRWQQGGVWRTTLKNQAVLAGFFLGIAPGRLGNWYHKPRKKLPY